MFFIFNIALVLIVTGIIIGIRDLLKPTKQFNKHTNQCNKPIPKQQKTCQPTYYDTFNSETYKPLQQKIVKDFYKDYEKFDPIKPKVKNTIYDNLLHTDNWKAKRDKILKRDNYTCRYCGRHDGILQVHHKYYNVYPNSTKPYPWDYPDDALITLCEDCHKRVHQNKKIKTYYRKKYLHYYD